MLNKQKVLKSQAGFTLVELAIVMIIIGLLIGGVLKGQQLITNAQITATVAQIKAIDTATTSFKDQFNGLPGDLASPTTTLPNCTATNNCSLVGTAGDSFIGVAANTFSAAATGEQLGFWAQLNAAGLMTGLNPSSTAAVGQVWGGDYPASKISGGGFDVGSYAGGTTLAAILDSANASAGLYLAMHGQANNPVNANAADSFLTPNLAARIDTKIDDGQPNTGVVIAAGQATCTIAAPAGGNKIYNQSLTTSLCSIYTKIQN